MRFANAGKGLAVIAASAGNKQEPAAAFRAFRGRDPQVQPMLAKRGLLA